MGSNSGQVCTRVRDLIVYLRSLEGDDRERRREAAQIIEEALTTFVAEPEPIAGFLDYYLGGKGMLDWIWSDSHRSQLEQFSDEILRLPHPRWWEFWK